MNKIILASASPRRRELLSKAGVSFTVIPSQGEEHVTCTRPCDVVEELSETKAFSVANSLADAQDGTIVIGSDTIVAYQDEILGKPKDAEDAVQTLLRLQGNTHQVYTGVTVLVKEESWTPHTFFQCTDVTFYPVSEEEIRSYVQTGSPLDKAGSYGIQDSWGIYVEGIRGDYNNVVGLPVSKLFYEMKKIGINLRG